METGALGQLPQPALWCVEWASRLKDGGVILLNPHMVEESVEVKSKKLVSASLLSPVQVSRVTQWKIYQNKQKRISCLTFNIFLSVFFCQLMGCGANGVSGVDVDHLPLEKFNAIPGRESEGERGTVLIENTMEACVKERLFNMATAMTLATVTVSVKKNHSCVRNCIPSSRK